MKNCLKDFLRLFDYFGVVFTFRIKDKYTYKSSFGGLIFIFFLIFSILYFVYSFRIFWNRELYSLSYFTSVISPSPEVNFHNSGLNIAYSLLHENYTSINNEVFEFFEQKTNLVKIVDTNISNKERSPIYTRECTIDDFHRKIDDKTFNSLNLSRFFCAKINPELSIKGSFADKIFQYIEVELSIKDLAFTNSTNKLINLNYISNYMKKNPMKIVLYWLDTTIEVVKGNTSLSNFLNSYVTFIDFMRIKKTNINFGLTKLYLDNNYFIRNPEYKQNITFDQYQESTLLTDDRLAMEDLGKTMAKFYIRSSPRNIIVNMNYMKITEFLGNFGGLQSNVLLFLFILVRVINDFRSEQKLMNNIFRYDEHFKIFNPLQIDLINNHLKLSNKISNSDSKENKNRKVERSNSLDGKKPNKKYNNFSQESDKRNPILDKSELNKFDIEMSEKRQVDLIGDSQIVNQTFTRSRALTTKIQRKNTSLKTGDIKILSKSTKPLSFSSCEIIISLFMCKTKSIKLKEKIHSRAIKKTQYYMDIYTYIKKVQEIDLLKFILLDENQVKLFKFLSKPSVNMSESIQENLYEKVHSNQLLNHKFEMEELQDVIRSFGILTKKNDDISQRLVNFFEYEAVSLVND